MLHDAGFRKDRHVYARDLADIGWLIEIELGQFNSREECAFRISGGVWVPGFQAVYDGCEPERPMVALCCIWSRLGTLSESRLDVDWSLRCDDRDTETRDRSIGQDIRQRIENDMLPFLGRFRSRRDVIAYLLDEAEQRRLLTHPRTRSHAVTYAAIIEHLCGNDEQCFELLRRARELLRRGHPADWLDLIAHRILGTGH